ncbi:MAG: PDZ domain-containing protein [Akkermansiaceae bacterium]|nr:PDZ domain-containing protein [Akkermansiaceae bacterium]
MTGGAVADNPGRLYVNDKKAPESLRDLRKIEEALQGNLGRAREATVGIELGEGGAGSGVIVSEDGLVLTAAHVSGGVGDDLVIITADGERHDAISLGLVASTDAAMVRIKEGGPFPFVEIDADDTARLGDWVFSLGHSGGYDDARGVVVRLGRIVRVADVTIQSDCKLIGGDSGGPLFDMNGRLIGIHSRVGASLEQNMHVPIREFHRNWDKMLASEFIGEGPFAKKPEPAKAYLGVAAEAREEGGVEVTRVLEDTAAADAGLETGDVILEIDGEEIEDMENFLEVLKGMEPGDKIELTVLRDGEDKTIEVELGER